MTRLHQTKQDIQKQSPGFVRLMLSGILLILAFGQPNGLFLIFPPYVAVTTIAVCIFLIGVIVFRTHNAKLRLPHTNLMLPALLFLIYSVLSLLYASDPQYGARILASMFFKVACFVGIVSLCTTVSALRQVVGTLAWIGTAFALQATALVIGVVLFGVQPSGEYFETTVLGTLDYDFRLLSYGLLGFTMVFIDLGGVALPRSQALFVEPGWLATFLELSIFATLAYIPLQKKLSRNRVILMLGVQSFALILTFSTAGWFAVIVGVAIYIFVVARGKLIKFIQIGLLVGIAISCLIASMLVTAPGIVDSVYQSIFVVKFDAGSRLSSGQQRANDIGTAIDYFSQRPVLGWGSNQLKVINAGGGANNALATVAAELGIAGLVLYCTMLLMIVRTMIQTIRLASKLRSDLYVRVSAAVVAGVIALLIHSMFIESSWSFLYWLGLSVLYCTHEVLRRLAAEKAFVQPLLHAP